MAPARKVVLIRQDGTRLQADPDQAEKLKLLGYQEEGAEEKSDRLRESAREEYYTSTEQQLYTAAEGLGRGASLGITDYVLGDEHTSARAGYNPGIATATELAGAVLPELVPGLNVIAPSAMVGRGARALVKGEGLAAKTVRGAVEGAAFGGAAAADHTFLAGDPVTAEAVLHGMGWGALFGAGVSAAGGALTSRGTSNATKGAAMEADAAAEIAAASKPRATPGAYEAAAAPTYSTLKMEARKLATEVSHATKTAEAILRNDKRAMARMGLERTIDATEMNILRKEANKAYNKLSKAMDQNPARIADKLKEYEATIAKAAERAGLTAQGSAAQAVKEMAQMKVLQKTLKSFPETATGFAKMTDERAETLFASLDAAKKLSKWPAVAPALDDAANKLQESLGISGTGVDGLRSAWQAAKKSLKLEGEAAAAAKTSPQEPSFLRKAVGTAAGYGAFKAATVVAPGHPLAALGVGAKVRNFVTNIGRPKTPELIAARNQTLGRIKQAVGKYQVKAGKAASFAGPKMASLAIKLDGSIDTSSKNPSQLAYNRVMEFAAAAPGIKNTIFRGLEPVLAEQPELGAAMHKAALEQYNAMRGFLPADPGVVSALKSVWQPSALQAAVMSKQLSVFQDPVGVMEEMLTNNIYDPIQVKCLKAVAPAAYQNLRDEMLVRIQEPGFLASMDYKEQVSLGALLDIPIHSSMRPEFIAASQALHFTRNQPLPTPAVPGSSNGGRPAGPAESGNSTPAQVSTAR